MRRACCFPRLLLMLALLVGPAWGTGFLEPTKAFRISARALDESSVEVAFQIARGYYMYREQFRFEASGATLGTPEVPPGAVKFDETFQRNVETHRGHVAIRVPVRVADGAFRLTVISQGCADAGLCYPPMTSILEARLAAFGGVGAVRVVSTGDAPAQDPATQAGVRGAAIAINTESPTDGASLEAALRGGSFWSVVGVFFAAGLLLSLTPCVLPMLPIVSSIVVGVASPAARLRGLLLATSYSLGMALVYTGLGIAAGLAGEGLAAWLQAPWVLALFALALVGLALSMFGFYELRLPASVATRLAGASQRFGGQTHETGPARLAGVFSMGGISALIVSPCVAAPLAGALVYLSQTGDVRLGGTALFSLAAGMSVPLLLLGASAGALLPRAGAWMNEVKRFFGLLLLGVAIWIVQPALPAAFRLALWGALALGTAVWLGTLKRRTPAWRRAFGAVAVLIGGAQLVGAVSGGGDPLRPLAHLRSRASDSPTTLRFEPVRSIAELDAALAQADKPVMLDFYADWCVSCKEMERFTFSDARVQAKLGQMVLLKADVTRNSADDRALMRRFGLFGPPGTLFFDRSGSEIADARVIGFINAPELLRKLQEAGL